MLNVTPDSFSDGGEHDSVDAAIARAAAMLREGADLIDVGGESSRPGAQRVPPDEQIARVVAVIRAITTTESGTGILPVFDRRSKDPVTDAGPPLLSIDTTRAPVAAAALDAGAAMINDISAGRDDPAMLPLAAERGVPICLMHMQGTPGTMQQNPRYTDVAAEVEAFLLERRDAAVAAGVTPSQIILDPGIGFGKTFDHNLALLRALPASLPWANPSSSARPANGSSPASPAARRR